MVTRTKKKKPIKSKQKITRRLVAKSKSAKKAPMAKKRTPKRNASASATAKIRTAPKKPRVRGKREDVDSVVFDPKGLGPRSAGQSGDLQGLSNRGSADSESVDELLEEGNAFEANVVKGVEDVLDADEGGVRTHEVPEDDVPEEYLERDE